MRFEVVGQGFTHLKYQSGLEAILKRLNAVSGCEPLSLLSYKALGY
jgi:hypothetical protein